MKEEFPYLVQTKYTCICEKDVKALWYGHAASQGNIQSYTYVVNILKHDFDIAILYKR
jgi:hypothetical protein